MPDSDIVDPDLVDPDIVDPHTVSSMDQLRALYAEPSARVVAKKCSTIGPQTATRLASSPFVLLATADADGRCDVSPRGGPAGMVRTLDDKTVAIPDLGGNNLVDSLTNILSNPRAALLVLNPGVDETVRLDGEARLSIDPELLAGWDGLLRRPKLAVIIEINSVFIHCAKAFRRSGLWRSETWTTDVPDACVLYDEHTGSGLDVAEMREFLEEDYRVTLAREQPT